MAEGGIGGGTVGRGRWKGLECWPNVVRFDRRTSGSRLGETVVRGLGGVGAGSGSGVGAGALGDRRGRCGCGGSGVTGSTGVVGIGAASTRGDQGWGAPSEPVDPTGDGGALLTVRPGESRGAGWSRTGRISVRWTTLPGPSLPTGRMVYAVLRASGLAITS